MRAIHLEAEHATTGERKRCEYVETLASGTRRRRARARAVVVRWPNMGGPATFCIASGWHLPNGDTWRLTSEARAQARKLAKAEGLELPAADGLPPHVLRARARARADELVAPTVDPRQERLPFETKGTHGNEETSGQAPQGPEAQGDAEESVATSQARPLHRANERTFASGGVG